MTADELGALHPRLYHVTAAGAAPSICRHGLLPASDILKLWEVDPERRTGLLTSRRPRPERFDHPRLGSVIVNDNAPLSETKLAAVLDNDLTSADWLRMLNGRVFFFAHEAPLDRLLGARLNRGVAKDIMVFDTAALARRCAERMAVSPINTGNTARRPSRRGTSTFAPLLETDFRVWRRGRGLKQPDSIKEVSVLGAIPDIASFLLEVRST